MENTQTDKCGTPLAIRFSDEVLKRLERARRTLAPPLHLTRSDAVRMLLHSALEQHEREQAEVAP